VPLILWSYQTAPATEEPSPWFICAGCDVQVVTDDGESEPAEWIAQASMPACSQRLGQMLLAENLLRWLNQIVMPALDREESACLPLALGAGFASSLPEKNGNVWQQWITDKTCLTPEVSWHISASYALSFPDAILPLLPRQSGQARAASMGNGAGNDHRRWDHCALPVCHGEPQFAAAGQR
jgi:hypothetical protein